MSAKLTVFNPNTVCAMRVSLLAVIAVSLAAGLAGCGQKGDLYLLEDNPNVDQSYHEQPISSTAQQSTGEKSEKGEKTNSPATDEGGR